MRERGRRRSYASTTKEVNYGKYFALGGLKLDALTEEAPGRYIGLDTHIEKLPPGRPLDAGKAGVAFRRDYKAAAAIPNYCRTRLRCDRSEIEFRCLGLQRSYPSQTRHWASERLGGDRRVGGFGGGITAQS